MEIQFLNASIVQVTSATSKLWNSARYFLQTSTTDPKYLYRDYYFRCNIFFSRRNLELREACQLQIKPFTYQSEKQQVACNWYFKKKTRFQNLKIPDHVLQQSIYLKFSHLKIFLPAFLRLPLNDSQNTNLPLRSWLEFVLE